MEQIADLLRSCAINAYRIAIVFLFYGIVGLINLQDYSIIFTIIVLMIVALIVFIGSELNKTSQGD